MCGLVVARGVAHRDARLAAVISIDGSCQRKAFVESFDRPMTTVVRHSRAGLWRERRTARHERVAKYSQFGRSRLSLDPEGSESMPSCQAVRILQ